ncbi:efflux RND transporter periplasmic adaptor subunit [Alkaliphilus metalliredigens]|nr:efflux RND transporter periplasmic adaptor subunit [Alkaliphilus metalliredigens]
MITTVILAGCSSTTSVEGDEAEPTDDYVAVEVSQVEMRGLANEATLNGRVFSENEVMVLPRTPGIVDCVNVKLGDSVQKDQVLFVLEQDSSVLLGIEQAEEAVKSATKGTEQAAQGIALAENQYKMAKDQYDDAQANLERIKSLYDAGAVPKTQLDQAEMAAADGSLVAARSQITQAEISYQQTLGQLRQAEISVDQARTNLNHLEVKAPASGIISTLDLRVGQMVTNAQPVATIVDVNALYIQFELPENMINQFKRGQEVVVSIPAANVRDAKATVGLVSAATDQRTQLYPVRIDLTKSGDLVRPGSTGEVQVATNQTGNALIIESRAILNQDNETLVYVVENDHAVERKVTLGLDTAEYVEIIEGVSEGQQVII